MKISIADVWVRLEEIDRTTLSESEYLLVSTIGLDSLLQELGRIAFEEDAWGNGEPYKTPKITELQELFGLQIVMTTTYMRNGFKILEEVKTNI